MLCELCVLAGPSRLVEREGQKEGERKEMFRLRNKSICR